MAKRELESYYPETIEEEKIENKPRVRKKKKVSAIHKLLLIGIAIIILLLSLFILYRYSSITGGKLEIDELEKYKIELEKEKEILIAELETVRSSSRIEENAIVKLGMDFPRADQIVYMDLDMEETDMANLNKLEEEIYILGRLKNIANLVLDLF